MELLDKVLDRAATLNASVHPLGLLSRRVRWLIASVVLLASLAQLWILFEVDSGSVLTTIKQIPLTITLGTPVAGTTELTADELMELPLYERLLAVFPYSPDLSTPLEKNIIQTDQSKDYSNKEVKMWQKNIEDGFSYTMYDDLMAYRLLVREFGPLFPEIIEAYNNFPRIILRVDFFRYAGIFLRGGTYGDTDTKPLIPLLDWPTYNETVLGQPNTIGAVIGIEAECDCKDWHLYSSRVQFCQWTIQGRKHHPMYAMLLANIVQMMMTNYDRFTRILKVGDKKYDFSKGSEGYYDGIMVMTGPGMFSASVFQYINSLDEVRSVNPNDQEAILAKLKHPHPDDPTGSNTQPEWSRFGWENVTMITKPLLVNDILILPEPYWGGKPEKDEDCILQHLFHGSWKGANKGITDHVA